MLRRLFTHNKCFWLLIQFVSNNTAILLRCEPGCLVEWTGRTVTGCFVLKDITAPDNWSSSMDQMPREWRGCVKITLSIGCAQLRAWGNTLCCKHKLTALLAYQLSNDHGGRSLGWFRKKVKEVSTANSSEIVWIYSLTNATTPSCYRILTYVAISRWQRRLPVQNDF